MVPLPVRLGCQVVEAADVAGLGAGELSGESLQDVRWEVGGWKWEVKPGRRTSDQILYLRLK